MKFEDEDQFTYSTYDIGDQGQDYEDNDGIGDGEDDENEYGDYDDERRKVWFAGSGRDDWCKMIVDVKEQIREAQRMEAANHSGRRSMRADGGVAVEAAAASGIDVDMAEEPRQMSLKEYV